MAVYDGLKYALWDRFLETPYSSSSARERCPSLSARTPALVRGDLRHLQLDVERAAGIDDRHSGYGARQGEVFGRLVARVVAGRRSENVVAKILLTTCCEAYLE